LEHNVTLLIIPKDKNGLIQNCLKNNKIFCEKSRTTGITKIQYSFTHHSVCCFKRNNSAPSEQASQRMGKKKEQILVLGELSLTSLEDFYKQHIAYSRALSTLTDCPIHKKQKY